MEVTVELGQVRASPLHVGDKVEVLCPDENLYYFAIVEALLPGEKLADETQLRVSFCARNGEKGSEVVVRSRDVKRQGGRVMRGRPTAHVAPASAQAGIPSHSPSSLRSAPIPLRLPPVIGPSMLKKAPGSGIHPIVPSASPIRSGQQSAVSAPFTTSSHFATPLKRADSHELRGDLPPRNQPSAQQKPLPPVKPPPKPTVRAESMYHSQSPFSSDLLLAVTASSPSAYGEQPNDQGASISGPPKHRERPQRLSPGHGTLQAPAKPLPAPFTGNVRKSVRPSSDYISAVSLPTAPDSNSAFVRSISQDSNPIISSNEGNPAMPRGPPPAVPLAKPRTGLPKPGTRPVPPPKPQHLDFGGRGVI